MLLPLWMLRSLQMRRAQKLGLACLFLLATIGILFDVLRMVYAVYGSAITAYAALWDVLEPTIAVIISCLPSYRALFKHMHSEVVGSYDTLKTRPVDGVIRLNQKHHELRIDSAGLELGSSASLS